MPNSLKTKLSKLRYKCQITNEEYQELITKLDGHDSKVKADERTKVLDEAYDMLADELIWVLHSCGDDVYLQIADSIRTTFGQILKGEQK